MSSIQAASIAVNLMGKAVELAAKWAATRRRNGLAAAAARPEDDNAREIVFLRDRVAELISQEEILRQLHKPDNTTRCTIRERDRCEAMPHGGQAQKGPGYRAQRAPA